MVASEAEAAHVEAENIDDIDVSDEMRESFLEYAYSVIYARALPDARDGMKPVQRRILYQMHKMGLTPDRGHVKSQRVVGEVMGKLHPHGDAPIYDALVRLAQGFNLRLPLVDGHGNFGSLDDGPAAARYTEARLSEASLLLMNGLDEDAVDFVPNYDNQFTQPDVLPVDFPALLVNGASGIAVGMATSIAPHNPAETIRGAAALLNDPDLDLEELLRYIPGPDFPEGGIIPGLDGVRTAYETGRGTFKVRGKVTQERISARKNGLVITELPYMVGPERLIERIKDAVNAKKVQGISAVTNLTDRHHGLRVVVDIKSGFDPQSVLALLYRHTPLEETFAFNGVALVDGEPRTMPLLDMLRVFVEHRLDVERRVSQYLRDQKMERHHLVEGLLVAVLDIDRVIAIIRGADDAETARQGLQETFALSQPQAEYILQLRLRRLTKFSTLALENEKAELETDISRLERLLASPQALRKHVADRLAKVADELDSPRRTVLLEEAPADMLDPRKVSAQNLEIRDEPCIVVLTPQGGVARIVGDDAPASTAQSDLWASWAPATTRGECLVITDDGLAHRIAVESLPSLARSELAQSLAGTVDVTELVEGGRAVAVFADTSAQKHVPDDAPILTLGTAGGVVKRVRPEWPASRDEWPVISLDEGDRLVGASPTNETDFAVFVTTQGQLLKFPVNTVRPQGPSGGGVRGIRLGDEDEVIFFAGVEETPTASVATVTEPSDGLPGTSPGSVKITPLTEYPAKGRATMGVRTHRFLKGEGSLRAAWVGPHAPKAQTAAQKQVELPEDWGKRDGSGENLTDVVQFLG